MAARRGGARGEYRALDHDQAPDGAVDDLHWRDLPDMLQAQVIVQLRADEQLLWAGRPTMRASTLVILFALWTVLLVAPAVALVEAVEDTGGWWAIAWAVVSVFLFVPRVSRGSRVVFALTTKRAFVSTRSMYCSIDTTSLPYTEVAALRVATAPDGTADIRLVRGSDVTGAGPVIMDSVVGYRDACRVLQRVLPREVVKASELEGKLAAWDEDEDDAPHAGGAAPGDAR